MHLKFSQTKKILTSVQQRFKSGLHFSIHIHHHFSLPTLPITFPPQLLQCAPHPQSPAPASLHQASAPSLKVAPPCAWVVSWGRNRGKYCCSPSVRACVSGGLGGLKNTRIIEGMQWFILVQAIDALRPTVDDPYTQKHLESRGYNIV